MSLAEGKVLVKAGVGAGARRRRGRVGVRIEQIGGYRDIDVPSWIPIGVTVVH